jgi:hypothetical protein
MAKRKIQIKRISELPQAEGKAIVLAEENRQLKQLDLEGLDGSGFSFNPIIDGEIDGENCRFFLKRQVERRKTLVYLNGVKLAAFKDYFYRPDKTELVFSFAPYLGASLEIYSN